MARTEGIVLLVLGVVGIAVGFLFFSWCTVSFFGTCLQYGYQGFGLLVLAGGALFLLLGAVLAALPEKNSSQPMAYPPTSVQYFPQPPIYAAPYRPTPPEPATLRPSGHKFCPTCGGHYPVEYKLCPKDGAELKVGL